MPSRSPSAATRQARANTLDPPMTSSRPAWSRGPSRCTTGASPRAVMSMSTSAAARPSSPAITSSASTPPSRSRASASTSTSKPFLSTIRPTLDDAEAGRGGDRRPGRDEAGEVGVQPVVHEVDRRGRAERPQVVDVGAGARDGERRRPQLAGQQTGRVERRAVDVLGVAGERERTPVSRAASHVTVVEPWAKWACRWTTSPSASTRSATATACSSSLRYTLRGRHRSRARTAWAAALAMTVRTATGGGRRRGAAPAGRRGGWPAARPGAVVADNDVIAGRYHGTACTARPRRGARPPPTGSARSGGGGRRAAPAARSRWR